MLEPGDEIKAKRELIATVWRNGASLGGGVGITLSLLEHGKIIEQAKIVSKVKIDDLLCTSLEKIHWKDFGDGNGWKTDKGGRFTDPA